MLRCGLHGATAALSDKTTTAGHSRTTAVAPAAVCVCVWVGVEVC